jgi:hypothetical protein
LFVPQVPETLLLEPKVGFRLSKGDVTAAGETFTLELNTVPLEHVAVNVAGPLETLEGTITLLLNVPVELKAAVPSELMLPLLVKLKAAVPAPLEAPHAPVRLRVPDAVGVTPFRLKEVLVDAGKVIVPELITSPESMQVARMVAGPAGKFEGRVKLPLKFPEALVLRLVLEERGVTVPFCTSAKLTALFAPGVPQLPLTVVVPPSEGKDVPTVRGVVKVTASANRGVKARPRLERI